MLGLDWAGVLGMMAEIDKSPRHARNHLDGIDHRVEVPGISKRVGQMIAGLRKAVFAASSAYKAPRLTGLKRFGCLGLA